jgi:hypothetical protein
MSIETEILWMKRDFNLRGFTGASSGFSKMSHGHSIMDTRLDNIIYKKPQSLYFVYMRISEDGLLVKHLEDQFIGNDIEGAEKTLLVAARDPNTILGGTNFKGIKWRKACYFTIVIDNPGWKFHRSNCSGYSHDPFIFMSHKNIIIGVDSEGNDICLDKFYDPNYSFYDGDASDLVMDAERVARVRCINHFKCDTIGTDIGPKQYKDYSFEIFLEAPFTGPGGESITVLVDPDGQNQGPNT